MGIAIITGASSGMGREFALQLEKSGEVDGFLLVARREERLRALATELTNAAVLAADLGCDEGLQSLFAYLEKEKPEVKYLINAAGFGKFGDYAALPEADVAAMIDVNVKATVLITHRVLPYMERGGHVIELGSGSCFTPLPFFNVYAASKSFVLHYVRGLRREIAPLGVSVTAFCPGWVATDFFAVAETVEGAPYPKDPKPMLECGAVVRYALKRARKGKTMAVTGWYTKLQHMLFKLLPSRLLTFLWLRTVLKIK